MTENLHLESNKVDLDVINRIHDAIRNHFLGNNPKTIEEMCADSKFRTWIENDPTLNKVDEGQRTRYVRAALNSWSADKRTVKDGKYTIYG